MIRILLSLFQVLFYADIINALDEGRFLWVKRNTDNFTTGEKIYRPARWTRSIFNWLHSPLMNSIQESFVIDSVYVPSEANYKKRSVTTKPDDLKIEENFESGVFLFVDNKGRPMEFGLKQVNDLKPPSHLSCGRLVGRSVWEEPMFYEDNRDANEIDTNHLSYHERLKLSDMKQKMNSALKQIFTLGRTTKPHSIYYTLATESTTINIFTSKNTSNEGFLTSKKEEYNLDLQTEINTYTEETKNLTSGMTIENTSSLFRKYLATYYNFDNLNLPVVSNYGLLSKSIHKEPHYDEKINSEIDIRDSEQIFNHSSMPLVSYNRDIFHSSEPLFNLLKSKPKEAEFANIFTNDVKKHKRDQEKTTKPGVTYKYFPRNANNHRNLKTVLNRKFPKHSRKGNRKHKKQVF